MPGDEQRPGVRTEALSENRLATCSDDTAGVACRCVSCRRVLTADESVRLGLGPICRSRFASSQDEERRRRASDLLDALRARLDAEDGPALVLAALADAVALVSGDVE